METFHCQNGNIVEWFVVSTPHGMRGIVRVCRDDSETAAIIPTYDFRVARDIARQLVRDYNEQAIPEHLVVTNEAIVSLVMNPERNSSEERLSETLVNVERMFDNRI